MRFIAALLTLLFFSCNNSPSKSLSSAPIHPMLAEDQGVFLSVPHDGDVEFFYLDPQPQNLPYFPGNKLIGGIEAKPEDFPANFYTSQGSSRCSGTLLSEKTLISAAHCMGNGKTATLNYKGEKYVGTCTHHPEYRGNATADWALCYLDRPVVGIKFEKMLTDLSPLKVGGEVELSGFGCIRPGGGGGNDGIFRVGKATIKRLPSGSDNDTVTQGGAALCFGDSGGSAYVYVDGDRYMFAVNSRGDIRTTSYLVTFTQTMKSWAVSWASPKGEKICGLHADAKECRGATGPQPPPLPPQCRTDFDKLNTCLYGQPRLAISKPDECDYAFSNLYACVQAAKIAE